MFGSWEMEARKAAESTEVIPHRAPGSAPVRQNRASAKCSPLDSLKARLCPHSLRMRRYGEEEISILGGQPVGKLIEMSARKK
jgi:hypothetical protein